MKTMIIAALMLVVTAIPAFADYKLSQKTKMGAEGISQVTTIYQKGVRQRRETKTVYDDPEMGAMMAQMGQDMMPTLPTLISQCDLKQDVSLNEKSKAFFIDYYDWSSLPPEKLKRRPNQKMVIKGTVTVDSVVTDSGRRQQMFGLTARWLKWVQTTEISPDACENGGTTARMEMEGWFVTLSLESESCPIRRPTQESGGCRPRVVVKRNQNPGVMLTGTMKIYEKNKPVTMDIETLDLSKATLDQALFEVPKDWAEVDSYSELMSKRGLIDTSAQTVFTDPGSGRKGSVKTVAIDFFSGNASKVDQNELRGYISSKLTSSGMSGHPINSQSELAGGTFANVIGVEIKKVKESGASKIGGLFGKVTGSDDAAKLGNSSAEIVVTIYGKDGKMIVASSPASAEVKGKGTDAVKAAIDQVISGLLAKIK